MFLMLLLWTLIFHLLAECLVEGLVEVSRGWLPPNVVIQGYQGPPHHRQLRRVCLVWFLLLTFVWPLVFSPLAGNKVTFKILWADWFGEILRRIINDKHLAMHRPSGHDLAAPIPLTYLQSLIIWNLDTLGLHLWLGVIDSVLWGYIRRNHTYLACTQWIIANSIVGLSVQV